MSDRSVWVGESARWKHAALILERAAYWLHGAADLESDRPHDAERVVRDARAQVELATTYLPSEERGRRSSIRPVLERLGRRVSGRGR